MCSKKNLDIDKRVEITYEGFWKLSNMVTKY